MSIHPGDAPDPPHGSGPDATDPLPDEEHIDPAKVDEQLETEPDQARNATDGYAPADEGEGGQEEG
jgi:hypothetical protein